MKKSIFIVVLVIHDHYRFQTNLYADNDCQDCERWIIEVFKKTKDYLEDFKKGLPIIKTFEKSKELTDSETDHLWIQEF